MDNWISVSERPLYKNTPLGWECTEDGDKEFLAAIEVFDKTKDKPFWWIRHCVVEDEIGLCVVGDEENTPAGWALSDVQYWLPIPQPPNNQIHTQEEINAWDSVD